MSACDIYYKHADGPRYKNEFPYTRKQDDLIAYEVWSNREKQIFDTFKNDLLNSYELSSSYVTNILIDQKEALEIVWNFAWNRGINSGYSQVALWFDICIDDIINPMLNALGSLQWKSLK